MWNEWVKELFINLSILVTLTLIGSQLLTKIGLSNQSSLKTKFGLGILGATAGVILMNFTIVIPPENLFIDMRTIPIIITSIYGSTMSTLVTGVILSIFRWIYGGMDISAILGVISIFSVSLSCIIISKLNLKRHMKWSYMFIAITIITNIILTFRIDNKKTLIVVILLHTITLFIATVFTYILTKQLEQNYHLIRRLEKKSSQDFLTGLRNARGFNIAFDRIVKRVSEENERVSLLMIDIDYFKKVNDNYGHNIGDIVLKGLGQVIIDNIRETDITARIGGEEFCIIIPKSSSKYTVELAERIRTAVEKHDFFISESKKINITVSVGCAIYPDTVGDIYKIKELADKNLYKAKRAGRNRVVLE